MKNIATYLEYVSIFSVVLPLFLFFYLKNTKSKVINILIILIFISGISDITSKILSSRRIPNLEIINFYVLVQFIFAVVIYYHIYLKRQGALRPILISASVIILLLNVFLWQNLNSVQNLNWMITSMLIIVIGNGHFLYLKRYPVEELNKYAPYWITIGFVYYCAFSFGLFGISKFLLESLKIGDDFRFVWMFHNINNIFKNICFLIAIYWAAKRNPAWDLPNVLEN